MAYRPITDIWIMARPKVAYYGAYPAGFVERARALLGVTITDPVLHVCGGKIRDYPYLKRAVGPNDGTIDLDPECKPDFLMDVRNLGSFPGDLYPWPHSDGVFAEVRQDQSPGTLWHAALVDRPYTEADAAHYAPGADALPDPNQLLKRALSVVRPGGRVGFLDYYVPRPPKKVGEHEVKFVACIGVMVGFGNRMRAFTVFERVAENTLVTGMNQAADAAVVPVEVVVDPAMPENEMLLVSPDAPLVEPTPDQVAMVSNVVNAAEARKSLCRICWAKYSYPLPGPEHQPTAEAKCDDCGLKATLMPVSILLPSQLPSEESSVTVPTEDAALDGF